MSELITAAKLWLISPGAGDMPYLSAALFAAPVTLTPSVANAEIDRSWRLYVNPEWLDATDVPRIAGTLAHLLGHVLADHAGRAVDMGVSAATADAWHRAADFTIVDLLSAAGVPHSLTDSPRQPGRSAEEYFAILSGLPVDADTPADGPLPDCGSGCDGIRRPHDVAETMLDLHDQQSLRRQVAIAFREHSGGIGTVPGSWRRWVSQVLDPVVPWQNVLASAVRRGVAWGQGHTDYTYSRVSRRQSAARDVVMPALRRPIPSVAVVVDTSASMDDGLLSQALGEIDGVLKGLGVSDRSVTVLSVDAAVHTVGRVSAGRQVDLGGGGGTDMALGIAAAVALRPRAGLVIVLTDGVTPWPGAPPPVPVVVGLVGRSGQPLPPTPEWAVRVECVP